MEQVKTVFTNVVFQCLFENDERISHSTIVKYEQLIRNYVKPYFDHYDFGELNEAVLDGFYQAIYKQPADSRLSSGNMRTIFMLVNKALAFAHTNNYIPDTLYIKPCLTKSRPMVRIFSTDDQKKLEHHILKHKNKYSLAVLLALYSGIRIGELCALKWSDVDFDNDSIKITKTVQRLKTISGGETARTELVISSPKSSNSYRIIPLPKFVMDYMMNFYKPAKAKYFLLADCGDKPLEPRTLQYAYRKILKDNEIPYLNFHCLRHTFATRCIIVGWDIKTLSEILGHSEIKITMDYYFHSSFEYKKAQMNKLSFLS